LACASGADGYYLGVEGDGSVYTVDGTAAAAFVPAEELKSCALSPPDAGERAACRKSATLQAEPISACCAGQKFLPPGIPLGTKLSAEPRTRPWGLAHSQRSISLYVSRPSAHVGWTGLFLTSCGTTKDRGRAVSSRRCRRSRGCRSGGRRRDARRGEVGRG